MGAGACCPDLALLAPLARLLDTDLNTLLSFREELTGVEIAAFTEELYTLAQSGGIDAAFLRAEELLHRWPGCDRLTISLAMTLNGLSSPWAWPSRSPTSAVWSLCTALWPTARSRISGTRPSTCSSADT
ncbi:MAG: hypothetical protein ACLRIS_07190 [Flavonifractor plautii]